ncbi:chemotaxis protein CheB [Nitratireductor sp. ZSWI3]|uniref:chemotaxis protein CheB n=1 Tax=Nitratireductor sp. ZSWI3 TaxID=2966359 RepID=UPI0021503695|nr:chemotaxis protein CheB [Nitratireductor sp. ZSWI3]MCR4264727.1 chemotaxis protein CheB [Nitratireductor sp. ZSWI3]
MLRLLLVARNAELQSLVRRTVDHDEGVELVGIAGGQQEAIEEVKRLRPDILVIEPKLDGLEGADVVKEIMVEAPLPIVMISPVSDPDLAGLAIEALASGALAILPAPLEADGRVDGPSARKFLSSLAAMSQVKVVRRWRTRGSAPAPQGAHREPVRIVGIVASTGGLAAIKTILKGLPPQFPVPVLAVQHVASGHMEAVAASLNVETALTVKVAADGDILAPATVYLAPDGRHMGVSGKKRIRIADDPPLDGFRPSGTYLFSSLAGAFGDGCLAVVLTGMGSDGTEGLKAIRAAGGLAMAQDAASSAVFGMPKAAIDSGLVDRIVPLGEMPADIARLAGLAVS